MILDQINVAHCLTLDERIEELPRIKKEWAKHNVWVEPFIAGKGKKLSRSLYDHIDIPEKPPILPLSTNYPTWRNGENAYNAWLSHRKIFEKFIQSELPILFLLEDDIEISDDFEEILTSVTPYLETIGWDALYLGAYHREGTWVPTEHKNLIRICGSAGFHSLLLKKHVVEALLELDPLGPFDELASRFLHGRFNCYSIFPSVVNQKSGFSHVEQSFLNKPDRYTR